MLRESILRHIWLAPVIQACVFAAIWWRRGSRRIAENPTLRSGYRKLIWLYLIYTSIPWLILGAWLEPAAPPLAVTSIQFATAFAAILVIQVSAGLYWVFFAGGAEELATHPGLPQAPAGSARAIKTQWAIIIGSVTVVFVLGIALAIAQWDKLAALF